MRACARARVGTHPEASASGRGAFALLGYGAPVASLLRLRWVLVHLHWLAAELDARWLCLWWLPLSTYLLVYLGGSHLKKKKRKKKRFWQTQEPMHYLIIRIRKLEGLVEGIRRKLGL